MSSKETSLPPAPPAASAVPARDRSASPDSETGTAQNTPLTPSTGSASSEDSHSGGGGSAFPLPKLRLEVRDVAHPGARRFLSLVDASSLLPEAVGHVQRLLYDSPRERTLHMPPTRSVTVILRDMDGVAYTTGSDLDSDHKEIHFSLNYIAGIRAAAAADQNDMGGVDEARGEKKNRIAHEIEGVITHELVHCYQWNADGTCPGGLIEGIADFVRLRCDLSPPHWKRELDGPYDRGYQHTAYFLDYLETRFGTGTVRRINERLRTTHEYSDKPFWTDLLGRPVEQLWDDYVEKYRGKDGDGDRSGN